MWVRQRADGLASATKQRGHAAGLAPPNMLSLPCCGDATAVRFFTHVSFTVSDSPSFATGICTCEVLVDVCIAVHKEHEKRNVHREKGMDDVGDDDDDDDDEAHYDE